MAKRILIDARYLDGSYGGIATYSRCLLEHLALVDRENEYLVLVRPGFNEPLKVGENFELLTYRSRPISVASYLRLHNAIEELKPDILHSLAPHLPVFWDGPSMVTVHDMQPFTDPEFSSRRLRPIRAAYNLFYRWAYPTTLAKAKWVVCVSYATRDDIARLLPGLRDKLVVVRSGLETTPQEKVEPASIESARSKHGITGRYLLYYGSTRPNKNLPNLVRAFARLLGESKRDDLGDLRLVLVLNKDRFFSDVARVIASRKLQDRVLVLDPVSAPEQRALMAGANAFVFPTKYEGFGFPPLEAVRAGIPVLAGRSGALPEILEDTALYVAPDDIVDMANGIERIVTDEELRARLLKHGPAQVEKFNWRNTAESLRDIYRLLF